MGVHMPWVRIDEKAMDHPKIMRLSDGAFRLWVAGLAYCQKHLTDGAIPREALKLLPAMTRGRVGELVLGGMWEQAELGFQVHHYLEWNDSRAHVTKARDDAKTRLQRHRKRVSDAPKQCVTETPLRTRYTPLHDTTRVLTEQEPENARAKEDASKRAGAFCQWYESTHERLFSVGYIGTRNDYEAALRLVAKLSDQDLQDAAMVWFGMDDDFAAKGTRTIAKFASRASGCLQQARVVVGRST